MKDHTKYWRLGTASATGLLWNFKKIILHSFCRFVHLDWKLFRTELLLDSCTMLNCKPICIETLHKTREEICKRCQCHNYVKVTSHIYLDNINSRSESWDKEIHLLIDCWVKSEQRSSGSSDFLLCEWFLQNAFKADDSQELSANLFKNQILPGEEGMLPLKFQSANIRQLSSWGLMSVTQ